MYLFYANLDKSDVPRQLGVKQLLVKLKETPTVNTVLVIKLTCWDKW